MDNYFEMSRKELAAEKAKLEESYKNFRIWPEAEHGSRQTRPSPDGSGYGTFADDRITLLTLAPMPATTATWRPA